MPHRSVPEFVRRWGGVTLTGNAYTADVNHLSNYILLERMYFHDFTHSKMWLEENTVRVLVTSFRSADIIS